MSGLAVERRIARAVSCQTIFPTLPFGDWQSGDQPVSAVVSFGVAGGLDAHLAAGCVVLGTSVRDAGAQTWPVCRILLAAFRDYLVSAGIPFATAPIAHAARPVSSVEEKRALAARTGCRVVDMESRDAAQLALRLAVPLGIVRVVADPQQRSLPPLAAGAITDRGAIDVRGVTRQLVHAPAQLAATTLVGVDFARALVGLGRARGLIVVAARMAR